MTSPLERALQAMEERGGLDPRRSVDRVDVDDRGVLHLTLVGRGAARWFRFDPLGLREIRPCEDERVPLARELDGGAFELLSYRPTRRIVLRSPVGEGTVVIKGHRRKRSGRAVLAHRIAEGATADGGFRVPRLVEHRSETEALVLENLEGRPLEPTTEGAKSFVAVGTALRRLQEAPVCGETEAFGPEQELGVLARWAERVTLATGGLPAGWPEAHEELVEARAALPDAELGLAHRDLYDAQLLSTEDGPALLDFDLLCRADVALDPANVLAHLTLRCLQGLHGADDAGVEACGEALLLGLDRARDPSFPSRLRFYGATSFLRLSLVYLLRPRWSHVSAALIDAGRRCVGELKALGGTR